VVKGGLRWWVWKPWEHNLRQGKSIPYFNGKNQCGKEKGKKKNKVDVTYFIFKGFGDLLPFTMLGTPNHHDSSPRWFLPQKDERKEEKRNAPGLEPSARGGRSRKGAGGQKPSEQKGKRRERN